MDALQELQNQLGFECVSMHRYTSENVGFTPFILDLEKCSRGIAPSNSSICQCELGVGGWMQTTERQGRAIFLPMFMKGEMRMVVHKDNTFSSTKGIFFLDVFKIEVWALFILVYLFLTVLRTMNRRFEPPRQNFEPIAEGHLFHRFYHYLCQIDVRRRLYHAAFDTAFGMLLQGNVNRGMAGNSMRQWLLGLIVALNGLFFILSFEAVMTARLVQVQLKSSFNSIEDLRLCRINPRDVCLPRGGALESFWNQAIMSGGGDCHAGDVPHMVDSYELGVKMVANKNCKFLLSGHSAVEVRSGKYCRKLVTSGKPMYWSGNSMVMPNNGNKTVVHELSKAILDLRLRGRLQSVEEFHDKKGGCKPSEDLSGLGFEQLRVFFIASLSVCVVMMFCMCAIPQYPVGRPNPPAAGDAQEDPPEARV